MSVRLPPKGVTVEEIWGYPTRTLTHLIEIVAARLLSGVDGDAEFTASGSFPRCIMMYNNLTIASGVRVTPPSGCRTLVLFVRDTLTLDGTISAVGYGAPGGRPRYAGSSGLLKDISLGAGGADWGGGGGAGCWGNGGGGYSIAQGGVNPKSLSFLVPDYDLYDPIHEQHYGAGGGGGYYDSPNGGAGGGGVIIIARRIVGSGVIDASGADGAQSATGATYDGGGGGGGLIYILALESVDAITLRANGGNGGGGRSGTGGGGGGGGLIIVVSPVDNSSKSVAGGSGYQAGEPGLALSYRIDPFRRVIP